MSNFNVIGDAENNRLVFVILLYGVLTSGLASFSSRNLRRAPYLRVWDGKEAKCRIVTAAVFYGF